MDEDDSIFYIMDVPVVVVFNVTIENVASPGSGNDIAALSNPDANFDIVLHISNVEESTGSLGLQFTPDSCSDVSLGLAAGDTITLTCSVNVTIPTAKCTASQFFCSELVLGPEAVYIDANTSNNIACQDITNQKTCDPGKCMHIIIIIYRFLLA